MNNTKKGMGNNNTKNNTNNTNDSNMEYIMFKLIKENEKQFVFSSVNTENTDFIKYKQFLKNRYDLDIEDMEYRFYTDATDNKIESMIIITKSDYITKNFSRVIKQIKCDLEEELERYKENETHIYN